MRKDGSLLRKLLPVIWASAVILGSLYLYAFISENRSDANVLHVYAFMNVIPPETVELFEKETGIKVRISYYEANEELVAKLKAAGGKGYDVIAPSDYGVELLWKENLLRKIDKSRLQNFSQVRKDLTDRPFDPNNDYSVPSCWSVFGVCYRRGTLSLPRKKLKWKILYQPDAARKVFGRFSGTKKIAELDDAREVVWISLSSLLGSVAHISESELENAIKVLAERTRKSVESFSEGNAQFLLVSGTVPAAIITFARVKALFAGKDGKPLPREQQKFSFVIPKGNGLITIESLAIPSGAKNVDAAHKFIDFLLSSRAQRLNFDLMGYTPANDNVCKDLEGEGWGEIGAIPSGGAAIFPNLDESLHIETVERVWHEIRA